MSHPKSVCGFVCLFLLLYGGMLVPWPGWSDAYARYLRAIASFALAGGNHGVFIRFGPAVLPARSGMDSVVVLSLRDSPPRMLAYDSRAVGWIPMALTAALILSTPLRWRRRMGALLAGQLLIHLYVLLVLWVYLWNESQGRWPFPFMPFSPVVGVGLKETLVTQMGPSFVVPALIWLSLFVWTGAGNVAQNSHERRPLFSSL